MKIKKNNMIFIGISLVLLLLVIILWSMPNASSDKNESSVNDSTSISNVENNQETNDSVENENVTTPTENVTPSIENNVNSEMEKAIINFLTVWYTKKDRNEIEKLIGNNMTDQLKEKYFGTQSIPTPANEGGGEGDVVEYKKDLDSLDVYVKQKDGSYVSLYEAETTITIGENKSSQQILGKVKVINENGKWLVDDFEELDVKAK